MNKDSPFTLDDVSIVTEENVQSLKFDEQKDKTVIMICDSQVNYKEMRKSVVSWVIDKGELSQLIEKAYELLSIFGDRFDSQNKSCSENCLIKLYTYEVTNIVQFEAKLIPLGFDASSSSKETFDVFYWVRKAPKEFLKLIGLSEWITYDYLSKGD